MDSSKLDAAAIDEIEPFTYELSGIIRDMQEKLVTETRILEGTEDLVREDIVIPLPADPEAVLRELTGQNELSGGETKEDQWNSDFASGCSTTAPTQNSILGSSSSACIAELFDQSYPIQFFTVKPSPASTRFSGEKLESCGCAIDATSECCDCMVQTISVPMVGMPNEEK